MAGPDAATGRDLNHVRGHCRCQPPMLRAAFQPRLASAALHPLPQPNSHLAHEKLHTHYVPGGAEGAADK